MCTNRKFALIRVHSRPNFVGFNPAISYSLPRSFNFSDYVETENEFWALFPETHGKRVNFCQLGLACADLCRMQRESRRAGRKRNLFSDAVSGLHSASNADDGPAAADAKRPRGSGD